MQAGGAGDQAEPKRKAIKALEVGTLEGGRYCSRKTVHVLYVIGGEKRSTLSGFVTRAHTDRRKPHADCAEHLRKKQGTDVWYAEITDVKQCGKVRKIRKRENSKSRKIGQTSKGLSKTRSRR